MNRLVSEENRLTILHGLDMLDTGPEDFFEIMVDLIVQCLGTPAASISLLDEDREWLKARRGLSYINVIRPASFCTVTIRTPRALVVSDTRLDKRFYANPMVMGAPYIRSYLGFPLEIRRGLRIGAIAGLDFKSRRWSPGQIKFLERMARLTARYIDTRFSLMAMRDVTNEILMGQEIGTLPFHLPPVASSGSRKIPLMQRDHP